MTKLNFLVALMTDDNDYQLEQARSAETTAVKLGIDHQILYADNDAVTQSTQLLKAIQAAPEKRPRAIVCEPVGGTAMQAVARAAVTAGIGWAVLNRDVDYVSELQRTAKVPVFCVSSDHLEVGRIQARQCSGAAAQGRNGAVPARAFGQFGSQRTIAGHGGRKTGESASDRSEGAVDGRERATGGDLVVEAVDVEEDEHRYGGGAE